MVLKALPVHKVLLVPLVQTELTVLKALPVHKALLVLPALMTKT